MEKPMIFEAMANVLNEVDAVGKGKTSQGKFSFKYRSIDDVMNALHSAFATHGVFLTQKVVEHQMNEIQGRGIHHIARVVFTFWAKDGSSISSEVLGECIENGDKGIGKCMSYALKTCLLQTFMIPTEDDSKDPDSTNQPIHPIPSRPNSQPLQTKEVEKILDNTKADVLKKSILAALDAKTYDWVGKTGKTREYLIDKTQNETDIKKLESFWSVIQRLMSEEG